MIETALNLSDSRLLLFGAIAVDTVCMGTLAVVLSTPTLTQQPSSLLLVALAITGPILALAVAGSAAMVSKTFAPEERARRSILAGVVLHLGVQTSSLLSMLSGCDCRPANLRIYVLQNAMVVLALLALLVPIALVLRFRKSKAPRTSNRCSPDSRL